MVVLGGGALLLEEEDGGGVTVVDAGDGDAADIVSNNRTSFP